MSKLFGHKRYELQARTLTKRAANFNASLARNKGYYARITKEDRYWCVYIRQK